MGAWKGSILINGKEFKVANKVCKKVLSLPVHPSLTREELDYIIKTLKEII